MLELDFLPKYWDLHQITNISNSFSFGWVEMIYKIDFKDIIGNNYQPILNFFSIHPIRIYQYHHISPAQNPSTQACML